ncbi:transposase, partial [Escherichia coli]
NSPHYDYGRWPQHDFTSLKKLRPQSVTSRIQPGSDVIVCAEMGEQWGYVGAKSRQRWLFYAYDRLRKTVVAHVFGERTMATLGRLMSLLSPFDVVIWMTDGWPLYESRLKGKRHNLNLRQHLARLGRKSLSFSKSVELHDKVIGHYLNIKHYQ